MKFQIENYENMSTEEKLAALEAFDPEKSGFVSKATFDKTASEAAAFKKQLREKMSEDEAQKAKEAEDRAALEARVAELEAEKMVNTNIQAYLAMGYDEKLAKSSAEALVKGDMETVFANQKTHMESRDKALRAEILKQTPPPASGGTAPTITKEQFNTMGYSERLNLYNENPDLYNELNGGIDNGSAN